MSEIKEKSKRRIPEIWEFLTLEEISKVETGGNAPQGEKYFKDGKYPFIRVQHFEGYKVYVDRWDLINDDGVKDYNLKLFPKGSIIFPKSGASIHLEKRAILPLDSYLVNHLCVITPNPKVTDPIFLFYALKRISFSKNSAGTTLPYLNLSYISKISIPVPPLPEQQKIVEILLTFDKNLELMRQRKEKLERIKKGLMNELLTGKKRVKW